MLKLIIGVKGTGKTKTLIDMANAALEVTKGDVVVVEKGAKLRYDIKSSARLIDVNEYMVSDAQTLYGFIAGILASNHDVTDLFLDGTLKICNQDLDAFEKMTQALNALIGKSDVNLTMTVSMAEADLPASVKALI